MEALGRRSQPDCSPDRCRAVVSRELGNATGRVIRDEGDLKTVATDIGEMVLDLNGWLPMDKIDWALKLVGSSTRFPRETLDRYVRSLLTVGGRLVFERTDTGSNQLRIDDTSDSRGSRSWW